MLNAEKWKNEILNLTSAGKIFAVANGKPLPCADVLCRDCDLLNPESERGCLYHLMNWLSSEYVEPTIDWSTIIVDTPILVSMDEEHWWKRRFAYYRNGDVFAWDDGNTSWTVESNDTTVWNYAKLAEDGDLNG